MESMKADEFAALANRDGSGDGSGYGYGDGYGYGYGKKIASISGQKIYDIDGVPTAIYRVKGNIAKGAILQSDLTFTPCFVVKQDVYFAHGDTLHEAMEALRDKLFEDLPEEERIEAFVAEHQPGVKYPNRDLFDWHHRLTGSCEAGRKAFVADRGLDMNGSTTPEEFVHLTRNAYGGEVIRKLEAYYHVD